MLSWTDLDHFGPFEPLGQGINWSLLGPSDEGDLGLTPELTQSDSDSSYSPAYSTSSSETQFFPNFCENYYTPEEPEVRGHGGEEELPLICLWIDCKQGFHDQKGLVSHIDRVHVEGRREDFACFWHGCPRRNRPFNARYKLLIHMRVHSGYKPNKCSFPNCSKGFSRLENLKIHERSHSGDRPYKCSSCPKAFSNSSDRAKHQKTHLDAKPYKCGCGKKYTDPSSLRKHAKIHNFTPISFGGSQGKVSEVKPVQRKLVVDVEEAGVGVVEENFDISGGFGIDPINLGLIDDWVSSIDVQLNCNYLEF